MDADGLTMACATTAEQRAARKAGLRTALVGLGAKNGIPQDRIVSFGLAGGLGDLPAGTVIDATRVVDEEGRVLWTGDPLGVPGARPGTLLGTDRVIDDPARAPSGRRAHRRRRRRPRVGRARRLRAARRLPARGVGHPGADAARPL